MNLNVRAGHELSKQLFALGCKKYLFVVGLVRESPHWVQLLGLTLHYMQPLSQGVHEKFETTP